MECTLPSIGRSAEKPINSMRRAAEYTGLSKSLEELLNDLVTKHALPQGPGPRVCECTAVGRCLLDFGD